MSFTNLNPVVRSAALISRLGSAEECRAYDSRIIYVFSGDLNATVDGKKLGHLGAGELIYIPAGIPYKLKSKFLEAALITFDVTSENPLPTERIPPSATQDFDESRCHFPTLAPFDKAIHLSEMESEAYSLESIANLFISEEGAFRARASAILKTVLLKLAEASDEHALPSRMVESLDKYIRENFADDISNTELGAIFGYHPFYISKILKDKKGITLKQYIIKYKLSVARVLLENSAKTINEISEQTGFTDASYFTKTFKGVYGETPKEYRNRFKDRFM